METMAKFLGLTVANFSATILVKWVVKETNALNFVFGILNVLTFLGIWKIIATWKKRLNPLPIEQVGRQFVERLTPVSAIVLTGKMVITAFSTYNLIRNFTMPQDSSFISHSTEGSSAGRLSENSCPKKAAIVPDMSGNFFVMKQTIDVPKY